MPCREWRVSRNDLDFLGRISINAVKLPLELPWEVPAFPKRSLLCSQTVPRPGVDDVPAEDQMIFNDLFAQTLLQQSCTSGRMVGWMYLYWTDCNCIFYIAAHTHTHTDRNWEQAREQRCTLGSGLVRVPRRMRSKLWPTFFSSCPSEQSGLGRGEDEARGRSF